MSYFILDNQFNVIPANSKEQWEDFMDCHYPDIEKNFPYFETNRYIMQLIFDGSSRNNLFIIDCNYINEGFAINTADTINNYNDALDIFEKLAEQIRNSPVFG